MPSAISHQDGVARAYFSHILGSSQRKPQHITNKEATQYYIQGSRAQGGQVHTSCRLLSAAVIWPTKAVRELGRMLAPAPPCS